jgi:secreted trypsin-like serine protease
MDISEKYKKIIDKMMNEKYRGEMCSKHLAVAIKDGKPITGYKFNYKKDYVLGSLRGSLHAEMNVVEDILRLFSPSIGDAKNYFPWFISKGSYLLS